jgi:site-specific DNA recombinase
MPKRVVIYLHDAESFSELEALQNQRERCMQYAMSRDLELVVEYCDHGVGADRASGTLYRLLADARAGTFDAVLIDSIDRLSRRVAEVAAFQRALDAIGVELHVADPGGRRGLPWPIHAASLKNDNGVVRVAPT